MGTLLLMACCTVAAALVTASRVGGLRKWLGYANIVDVLFTVLLFLAFHGTFTGMAVATLTGLIMALTLTVLRRCMGYERLERRAGKLAWVLHEPATRITGMKRIRMPRVRVTFA